MKNYYKLLILVSFLFFVDKVSAQKNGNSDGAKKNILKINLSALIFKNASLQYERVVNRNMSVALGVSIMPKTDLPFKNTLMDEFGDNADAKRAIETTQLSNFSITPEVRFYVGKKGAPNGFYIAPFARYNHLAFEQLYQYTAANGKIHKPLIGGKINNYGAGILFGTQWSLGKCVTLDWWIAGPYIGSMNGDLVGFDDMSDLSATDRTKLKNDIEDVNIPLTKTQATIGNNRVDVNLSGGFIGVRTFGFALGYKF